MKEKKALNLASNGSVIDRALELCFFLVIRNPLLKMVSEMAEKMTTFN
jgi:hypothetical protein